ncbi:MAG: hypothetical protein MZV70_66095 [Desulfobacterales bacterium]|nr:hypothetical protein [Desulfobacterales bacterium]
MKVTELAAARTVPAESGLCPRATFGDRSRPCRNSSQAAVRRGLVDRPSRRKRHGTSKPLRRRRRDGPGLLPQRSPSVSA